MSKFKTRYNKSWEGISLYLDFSELIIPTPGDLLLARCKYCKGNPINLSNMGIQALKSHYKGAQHLKPIETICNVKTITSLTTSNQDIFKPDFTAKVSEVPTCSKKGTLEKSPSIGSYLLKDDVTKSEIRWYMRTTMKQSSYNSCEKLKDLFCDMFPDSKIAERFALGPTKASYVICYGLAPFYKEKILKQLTPKDTEPPYFEVSFDGYFKSKTA